VSRILVTGGAGFIGSFVVDTLVEQGHQVRVVDSLHPAAHREPPNYLNADVEYLWGNLADRDLAKRAVADIDAVSHQASMVGLGVDFNDVDQYVTNNDLATGILLQALHQRQFTGRTVLASSMVVYGDGNYRCDQHGNVQPAPRTDEQLQRGEWEVTCPACGAPLQPEPVTEHAATNPQNIYAATKLHQEHLIAAYAREHHAPAIALRYHNVYGPRMPKDTPYAGVASIFRSALEHGRSPQLFEDGQQTRDFVHVSDVANANLLALTAPNHVSGAFNIASGTPCTLHHMASALTAAFGPHAPRPEVIGGYRLGDVRHVFGSTEHAKQTLGYTPAVDPHDGLTEFAYSALRD
jgi:dTDP-L-rhamnose 4-epimerase